MWYTREKDITLPRFYALALVLASQSRPDLVIPHFENNTCYKRLLGLVEKRPRAKVQLQFASWAEIDIMDEFECRRPSPVVRRPRKAARVVAVGAPDMDGDGDGCSSSSRHSSGSSTSSSSSSSSSSTSSSGSSSSGASAKSAKSRRRREGAGEVWGDLEASMFRLTHKPKASSWQMLCRHPAHRTKTMSCTCTRSYRKEGEEIILRKLKAWALFGIDTGTKAEHKAAWSDVMEAHSAGLLPTMEQLDDEVKGHSGFPDILREPSDALCCWMHYTSSWCHSPREQQIPCQ